MFDDALDLPSLLPSNASAYELAHSDVSGARRPLPAWLIKSVWNPWTCPLDLLPYLAAGLGLEIWRDSWPEARKREVVAAIWHLKRNKTKLKGIKEYLALVDAQLVSAHRPRDKRWWVQSQTPEERAVQMAAMPQIHIAIAAAPAPAPRAKAFWSGRFLKQFWCPGRAWMASDAAARHAARATYVDRGVVTPVTVRGLDGPLGASMEVALSAGASVAKLFWGARRFWGAGAAFMASDADSQVLSITPSRAAPAFAVPRGLVPVTVRPEHVAETVPRRAGMGFWGGGRFRGFAWGAGTAFRPSDAEAHVYDRVTLFDPARLVPSRQPYSFWGWSRWGRAPFTAEIRVDVRLTRPALQHGYGQPWGRRFWRRSDMTPFWDAVAAVRAAKAFRDTVWIDTALYAPIQFSAGLRFGDAGFTHFGDQRKLT